MKTLKKRGLIGGLKRNRMGNKWTNISHIATKNGFVCTNNISLFVMVGLTSLIVLLLLSPKFLNSLHLADHHHSSLEVLNENKLCEAIYRSEGEDRTHYPYGIKSVRCETKNECRLKCLESIRNNEKRFARHGGKGVENFIRFMSRRCVYCDFGECQARIDWQKNVKEIYYGRK